jgi:hypothetical protein
VFYALLQVLEEKMNDETPQMNPSGTEEIREKSPERIRRDDAWATPVHRLNVSSAPSEAINLNVTGRELTGPLRGFGQLWKKTYRIRLTGSKVDPEEVIKVWKENFAKFWPKGNHFYSSGGGMVPGEVALLNLAAPGGITGPGGMPLISTGVMVIYADEESFSFMTPEGHMFAGMITFSAFQEAGATVAQVQALVRANDPLYEISFRIGLGHKAEDKFWNETLLNLAREFGVEGYVQQTVSVEDPRVQWSQAKNIWKNAAIRTAINLPGRLLRQIVRR